MHRNCGKQIGESIGEVEYIEVEENVGWGRSLQIKFRIDLSKPIARGRTITIRGTKYWIPIKYEKLPRGCFRCSCVTHGPKGCKQEG